MRWLFFGHRGWIGQQIISLMEKQYPDDEVFKSDKRADSEKEVAEELDQIRPDRVVSLIGRTHGGGIATIDYLEGRLTENLRDNLYAPMVLALLCQKRAIHLTYLGTGCIFTYDDMHSLENNRGFMESDLPNYFDSGYSVVKGFTDRLMHILDQDVLNVRIRMPITSIDHPRNFISKITRYEKICSVPNSMTVLDDLLPVMLDMARKRLVGTINLTNPGKISHNEILDLYRELVDPTFTYQNFSNDEMREVTRCGRSNNLLDSSRLMQEYPHVLGIKEAVIKALGGFTSAS